LTLYQIFVGSLGLGDGIVDLGRKEWKKKKNEIIVVVGEEVEHNCPVVLL